MTSVHREKSREGINKGVMRKEKKERGSKEEEREVEMKIQTHHGTNAVCGCWSKCVVVGVGSINSSVTVETRRDGQIVLASLKSLHFYANTNVIQSCTTPRTEATMYCDDFRVFWKMTIK